MASSSASSPDLVPVSENDHLDEDKPIRGQNFVCLSFLSPEEVLHNKEVFTFSKFTASFAKQVDDLFTSLKSKYPDDAGTLDTIRENHAHIFSESEMQDQYKFFKEVHNDAINKDFSEKNSFRTNVRGIKVRGVFDTLKEAQVRADVLKRMGDKFDIFVGQVGCWCPWSPYPGDLEDQQYAETQLNTLMSKYKDNMQHRDELYAERKDLKIKAAQAAVDAAKALSAVQVTDATPADESGSGSGSGSASSAPSSDPAPAPAEAAADESVGSTA